MDFIFPLLILFMIGLLFMTSRQRRKQQQEHEAMANALQVGDVVRMSCGISGTVVDVDDEQTVDVEIAPEIITTWKRLAVSEKLTEDTTRDDDEDDDELTSADAPAEAAIGGTPTAAGNGSGSGPNLSKDGVESTDAGSTSSRSS